MAKIEQFEYKVQQLDQFDSSMTDHRFHQYDMVPGWCPLPLMQFLNDAVTNYLEPNEIYLEIGTYCGRSLAATLDGNCVFAIGIDPLPDHFMDSPGKLFRTFQKTLDTFHIRDRVTLIRKSDKEIVGSVSTSPAGVCFYDADHDSGHTYFGLQKAELYLANQAILIVDDYNIYGGDQQKPVKDYALDIERPVKTDVDRFLAENSARFKLLAITPWLNGQAIIIYNRNGI